MTEVDLNENNGLLYLTPNFYMKIVDFAKTHKIGFNILGLEGFSGRDNIVLWEGLIGRCLKSNTNNYKINIDNVINAIGK